MNRTALLLLAWLGLTVGHLFADAKPAVEVGLVKWGRSFDQATKDAKRTGKPIFVLFQEVPG